jgi:hypothetical protein
MGIGLPLYNIVGGLECLGSLRGSCHKVNMSLSSAQNLFREYIAWRARAVVYVAAALAVLGLFGFGVLIANSPDNVNRFGLLLEMIGGFSVIPHIVGKNRFRWLFERQVKPGIVVSGIDRFALYTTGNRTLLLGNILAAAGLAWLLADIILNPRPPVFPAEIPLRVALSLIAFTWLNAFMLVLIYRLFRKPEPEGLLAVFFAADLLVGFVGIFFAGILYFIEEWLGGGLRFTFRNGLRRVLLMATLPCLLAGLGFQLLAAFLP